MYFKIVQIINWKVKETYSQEWYRPDNYFYISTMEDEKEANQDSNQTEWDL